MFVLRPHCTPLAWADSDGVMNAFGIALHDSLWDTLEKWCKEETRWPRGRVCRDENKVFFHRKADALRFKLRFG